MKTLRLFLPATFLSLALCLSVYAGDMSTPGFTAPPPPPQQALSNETELESTGSGNIATSEFALDIWSAVLSFF